MGLRLPGRLAARRKVRGVVHLLQPLGQHMNAPQMAGLCNRSKRSAVHKKLSFARKMTTLNPIASACSIASIERRNAGFVRMTRQFAGGAVIVKKSQTLERGQPRSRMSEACTVIPRMRMAVTRLPLPAKCSPILVTPRSRGSCTKRGSKAFGGVSKRSRPRIARERPNEGR